MANQPMKLPTGANARNTTRNAVDLYDNTLVDRAFEDASIPAAKISGAVTPVAHAASHNDGGTDELTVQSLGSGAAAITKLIETDGAGGWTLIDTPTGDVVGPAGATGDNLASYDGATGKLIKDSTITAASVSSHLTDTANPHSTSIANVGSGTLAELNAAVSDADVPDDTLVVHLAGPETITGAKTLSADLTFGTGANVSTVDTLFTVQRSTAGASELGVVGNGANNAKLSVTRGDDANANTAFEQLATSLSITPGTSTTTINVNPGSLDCDFIISGDTDANLLSVNAGLDAIGVGILAAAGKLHVDQASLTGAKPVLYLDQADLSEEFVRFVATEAVGNPVEDVGAKTLTVTKFVRVNVNGTPLYLQVGTIA